MPCFHTWLTHTSTLIVQRLVLRIDGWDCESTFPSGHIVRVLGDLGDLKAEGEAVLVQVCGGIGVWGDRCVGG